ncbi:cytochrome P450 4C1-like [Camponotus floridanus]|uniref:cytochrome P450 4C1-like n=1 Tax=Camponotus floridanus TaxID=104421 RepID=UPI00059DC785|nr:cytochrome P450 4C1-like [Camponotus floridanus]
MYNSNSLIFLEKTSVRGTNASKPNEGNDLKYQEKIHKELKKIFKDSQKLPSVKELSQLKYLERVIKELRRLYPCISSIEEKCRKKMDNYIILEGTSVTTRILLTPRSRSLIGFTKV